MAAGFGRSTSGILITMCSCVMVHSLHNCSTDRYLQQFTRKRESSTGLCLGNEGTLVKLEEDCGYAYAS